MPTWKDLSLDSLNAARKLLTADHLRSSISRAYYAAYSAVASEMARQAVSFPHGWKNPGHDQLIRWLANYKKWPANRRRQLAKALRRLRKGREDADYRPTISLTEEDTIKLLKEAAFILNELEIQDEKNPKK